MGDFGKLVVLDKARRLTLDVYRATQRFPPAEQFGLTSQLRRASVSIGANVAEGTGRRNDPELRRFVAIARGSSAELEYLLTLAQDLDIGSHAEVTAAIEATREVSRMLSGLLRSLTSD